MEEWGGHWWTPDALRLLKSKGKGSLDLGQLKGRIEQISKWVRDNLKEAQEGQKARYDGKVKTRSFCPGDQVLLLMCAKGYDP